MKQYHLNYCQNFKCVAGACKHTCCAGWQMLIDQQTLADYKNEQSDFSATLKKGVNFKRSRFKVDKRGRCAFLNDGGLCEIIINLGEQSLCQVCRDHPRFRNFFAHATETGLGFCCEQATRVILSFEDKIQPTLVGDDGESVDADFISGRVLDFRQKALSVIQDRSTNVNDRLNQLIALTGARLKGQDFKKIVAKFASFERLDNAWGKSIKSIKKSFITLTDQSLSHYCEQFLANSIFRHVSTAEDVSSVRARLLACVIAWWVVNSVISANVLACNSNPTFDQIVDVVRGYSAEVEYSQKNLNGLYKLAERLIKS